MSQRKLNAKDAMHLNELSAVVMASKNPKATLSKLATQLSQRYQPAVDYLTQILNDNVTSVQLDKTPLKALSRLAEQKSQPISKLFPHYHLLNQAQTEITLATKKYAPNPASFVALISFVILLCWIFSIKVLPNFINFYSEFYSQVPDITLFVANFYYVPILLVVILLLFVLVWWLPRKLSHYVQELAPLPHYWEKVPMFHSLVPHYQRYLWFTFAKISKHSGDSEPQTNLPVDVAKIRDKDSLLLWKLALANDDVDDYITLQQQEASWAYSQSLEKIKRQVDILTFIVSALVIFIAVMSLYVPIFEFGEVIS